MSKYIVRFDDKTFYVIKHHLLSKQFFAWKISEKGLLRKQVIIGFGKRGIENEPNQKMLVKGTRLLFGSDNRDERNLRFAKIFESRIIQEIYIPE